MILKTKDYLIACSTAITAIGNSHQIINFSELALHTYISLQKCQDFFQFRVMQHTFRKKWSRDKLLQKVY
jgi:hypothetical protein